MAASSTTTDQRESAAFPKYSAARVDLAAFAIVTSKTLRSAAETLAVDESTLRVWRKEPTLRERVQVVRQQLEDEKLARYREHEQEVFELLLEIIRDKNNAPTARIAGIHEFCERQATLEARAREADNGARLDDEFESFRNS